LSAFNKELLTYLPIGCDVTRDWFPSTSKVERLTDVTTTSVDRQTIAEWDDTKNGDAT